MSPIKPALSEQEWADLIARCDYYDVEDRHGFWGERAVAEIEHGGTQPDDVARFRAAALCLYDHPAGFTREMAAYIRAGCPIRGPEDAVLRGAIADRIEALLPPELTRTNPEP